MFCEGGTTVSIRHGQNSLLNLRGGTKHTHDLGHPGTGDSLLPGNICLVDDLAGLQENLPLNGLPEELYDPGRPGHLGQFQVSGEGSAVFTFPRWFEISEKHPLHPSAEGELLFWVWPFGHDLIREVPESRR